MDKELACHSIALEVAKAYVDSNIPEYRNESGVVGMATDMAKAYYDAYEAAAKVVKDPKKAGKARIR